MKRWIAALLAALLLCSLTACQQTPTSPAEPEQSTELPATAQPEPPAEPAEPAEPSAPAEPPEEPITPPEEQEEPLEVSQPILLATDTASEFHSGNGAAAVTLYPTGLSVHTGSEQADQIINAYYQNVFEKLNDLCTGEVMELTENGQYHYTVTAENELARFDQIISIARTVTVFGDDTGLRTVTYYGETFDCLTGGLMTADNFFAVPEEIYMARLAECVRQQISEDPYHDQNYFAQWEDMALRALRKEHFYVTEDAYVVFYQENELGAGAAVFAIPWSQLEDIAA
ncbi:MAG: DUF3298 domain-containing protein [Oscillospiraceae bacterium]|nr:DUF3298 domain-containing protein [Oscillospiraceae bacterium]